MAFLGCSRGLGHAVCGEMDRRDLLKKALLVSRQKKALELLSEQLNAASVTQELDFSNPDNVGVLVNELKMIQPKRVFYVSGGGCYGHFATKKWKDHFWGLQVTFLTPAQLLHSCLTEPELAGIEQIIFVGSQIADSQGDPRASSYAAGKHALKGLIDSIHKEGCDKDIRLFRPGYMDTDLLPPNCPPRLSGAPLLKPDEAARRFVDWALDPSGKAIFDL